MDGSSLALAVAERGASLPGEGQVPLAPVLHADHTAALIIVIGVYAGFAATIVWALVKLLREQELLPLVLLVAGIVAANIEPVGDYVGSIVYAPNIPWFDYWILGRQMPSFIAVGEASYVAFGSYYAYRMIRQGRSLGHLTLVCAVYVGIPEIGVEVLWHHYGIIAYYGENPTRIFGIPLYSIVQNSTLLPVYGAVTFIAATTLAGRQLWWLLIAVPTVTIGYIVGVSWPVYEAVGSSASAPVVWAAAMATCGASVAVTYAVLQYPAIRELRDGPAGDPPIEPAAAIATPLPAPIGA